MRPGKIPVFRTVGAGIAFLFTRLPGILRAAVVPGILAGVSLFAMHWYVLPSLTQESAFGSATVRNPYLAVPFVAVYLFATIMFFVGVTKVYFREPIGVLYAGSRSDEWRLLGGSVGVVAIVFLLCGLPALGLFWAGLTFVDTGASSAPPTRHVVSASLEKEQSDAVATLIGLGVLVLTGFYLFLTLRFSLLIPASVKEKRFGVWASWSLMRSNAWRMIGVISLIVLFLAVLILPIGVSAIWLSNIATGETNSTFVVDGIVTLDSFLTVPGLITFGANTLLYFMGASLFVGAWGFAYQKLTDDKRDSA